MRALIQRVSHAKVEVDQQIVGQINHGLLVFIGVEKGDRTDDADRLLHKILAYRVFSDDNQKMNLSVADVNGGLLLVSQFTLAANTQKGLRPSFSSAAPPSDGEALYHYIVEQARQKHHTVATGRFGADMKVQLLNDGPVTFLLET
ncbi:D-tyrosyl-tRNA(Tyr) deacylase [Oceanospirillum multiglobuliferum]|uniref:D-aminoacyl-tRNA deacylase n=1 Tax=Oceanospirillum multiglobuliferum TaxID=64969 RepID=A0A1T4LWE0_9GAMM|nr:D-aminoacyl-tRNA deacylase [Oceanospirillum multiglobuliferum]OPX56337.1 D-tyrosyl-tRNA(Tyr) deacylase [Oceanospirillum multiglobuliferum]SJZ59005.1 D-tyrosyl-tRNA(Tyr) deacylase [Oceanospirillum multiglobuliferum]